MIYDFWLEDLFPPLLVVFLSSVFFLVVARHEKRWLYAAALAGAVAASWTGRIHAGGWPNVNMPTIAILATLFGLGVHHALAETAESTPRLRAFVLGAVAIQLACLAYNPLKFVPSKLDEKAGQELLTTIGGVDGDVLFFAHGHLNAMAGKPIHAHEMAVNDILGIGGGRPGADLKKSILAALKETRFAAVVLDTDFMKKDVETYYRKQRDVISAKDLFYPVAGMRTRPRGLYAPK